MFGGTGTVAVMAQKTGRHFIHMDISQKYCEIAGQRLETAKMLQEFPLSVGRVGRKSKIIKYKSSKKEISDIGKTSVKAHQNILLEKRGEYKINQKKIIKNPND